MMRSICILLLLLLLLLLPALCLANVDMVPLSNDGIDMLFVSWIDAYGMARLGRYIDGILISEAGFGERGTVSLAVCNDAADDPFLMLGLSSVEFPDNDTLYALDHLTLDTLDMESPTADLPAERSQLGLIRHQDPLNGGMMSGFRYSLLSSGTELYWYMQDYSISGGQIATGTLQDLFDPYPLGDTREQFYNRMVGPVTCQDGRPMMATDRHIGGGWGWPGNVSLMTLVWDPGAGSLELLCDTLVSDPDTLPSDPLVMALGSCSDRAVLIWADAWGDVMYSDYNCSDPSPISTGTYQWSLPESDTPCAMSCDPDDEGLLLVWHSPGEVRCRHFQDGWNGFDRVLWSGGGIVLEGNIAVCSVDDGYWVAWLIGGSDAEYPELQFVPRDSVTTIGGSVTEPPVLRLVAGPNPFRESLSIELEGSTGAAAVSIFDLAGRVVSRTIQSEDGFVWDPDDTPPGTYIIMVSSGEFHASRKVVLLD